MNALMALARKVRLAMGLGIVRRINDSAKVQRLQVSLLRGELREDLNRYQNYGFTSHPRPGCEAVVVAIGGNRSHLVALAVDDPRVRMADLEEGEVAVYNHEGDRIHFKNGGEIVVVASGRVTVTSPEVIVAAETRVRLETPLCEVTGDLRVEGTIEGDVVRTAAGISLGTHRHKDTQPGSGVSGDPQ